MSSANFYLLPMRAWELLAGAIIAYSSCHKITHPALKESLSCAGVIMITSSIFLYNNSTPFPSLYTLLPIIGTCSIIACGHNTVTARLLLSNRVMVGIGLISYSAYLWHQPLLALLRTSYAGLPPANVTMSVAASSFMLAYITWKYVETPCRCKQPWLQQRHVYYYSALGIAFFATIGFVLHCTQGLALRFSPEERAFFKKYDNYRKDYIDWKDGKCFFSSAHNNTNLAFAKECAPAPDALHKLYVIGDSHSALLAAGFRKLALPDVSVGQYAITGCYPTLSQPGNVVKRCSALNQARFDAIVADNESYVIINARWKDKHSEDGFLGELSRTINHAKQSVPPGNIMLVGTFPEWQPRLPDYVKQLDIPLKFNDEMHLPNPMIKPLRAANKAYEKLARNNGIQFYDPVKNMCHKSECLATMQHPDGHYELSTFDYGHVTVPAAMKMASDITQELQISRD